MKDLTKRPLKGFEVVKGTLAGSREWLALYRAGHKKKAADQLRGEQVRATKATEAAVDVRLEALAKARG